MSVGDDYMYAALDLAKYIVYKCVRENQPISNLKLQKILYNIQKFNLNEYNRPFFNDSIEAWQFGPVVPSVYYHYCGYGAMPITNSTESFPVELSFNQTINNIIEIKRQLSPWQLVAETHRPDGAWSKVYQNGQGNHRIMPLRLIKEEV